MIHMFLSLLLATPVHTAWHQVPDHELFQTTNSGTSSKFNATTALSELRSKSDSDPWFTSRQRLSTLLDPDRHYASSDESYAFKNRIIRSWLRKKLALARADQHAAEDFQRAAVQGPSWRWVREDEKTKNPMRNSIPVARGERVRDLLKDRRLTFVGDSTTCFQYLDVLLRLPNSDNVVNRTETQAIQETEMSLKSIDSRGMSSFNRKVKNDSSNSTKLMMVSYDSQSRKLSDMSTNNTMTQRDRASRWVVCSVDGVKLNGGGDIRYVRNDGLLPIHAMVKFRDKDLPHTDEPDLDTHYKTVIHDVGAVFRESVRHNYVSETPNLMALLEKELQNLTRKIDGEDADHIAEAFPPEDLTADFRKAFLRGGLHLNRKLVYKQASEGISSVYVDLFYANLVKRHRIQVEAVEKNETTTQLLKYLDSETPEFNVEQVRYGSGRVALYVQTMTLGLDPVERPGFHPENALQPQFPWLTSAQEQYAIRKGDASKKDFLLLQHDLHSNSWWSPGFPKRLSTAGALGLDSLLLRFACVYWAIPMLRKQVLTFKNIKPVEETTLKLDALRQMRNEIYRTGNDELFFQEMSRQRNRILEKARLPVMTTKSKLISGPLKRKLEQWHLPRSLLLAAWKSRVRTGMKFLAANLCHKLKEIDFQGTLVYRSGYRVARNCDFIQGGESSVDYSLNYSAEASEVWAPDSERTLPNLDVDAAKSLEELAIRRPFKSLEEAEEWGERVLELFPERDRHDTDWRWREMRIVGKELYNSLNGGVQECRDYFGSEEDEGSDDEESEETDEGGPRLLLLDIDELTSTRQDLYFEGGDCAHGSLPHGPAKFWNDLLFEQIEKSHPIPIPSTYPESV